MIIIDTSALIRFFTNDEPIKAQKVKKLLESSELLEIPDIIFPELEYVLLGATYKSTRMKVLQAFKFLLSRKNSKVSSTIKKAIQIYETSKLDIADCIIAAKASKGKLASFDKELVGLREIKPYW